MARVAFVVCGDVELAQEAVQAARQKAWTKLGSMRDAARLRPWLVAIAANETRQLVRSRHRRWLRETPIEGGEQPGPRGGPDPAGRAVHLDLANALAGLE